MLRIGTLQWWGGAGAQRGCWFFACKLVAFGGGSSLPLFLLKKSELDDREIPLLEPKSEDEGGDGEGRVPAESPPTHCPEA